MIKLMEHYLSLNHYPVDGLNFEDAFQSHPNYPSLFAVTDTLDLLQIENIAARVDQSQFGELPDTFLSLMEVDNQEQFVLVSKKGATVTVQAENLKKTSFSTEAFCALWDGVVLAVEENDAAVAIFQKRWFSGNWVYLFLGLTLAALFLFHHPITAAAVLYLTTSLLGLMVSILIVQEKIGTANDLSKKICDGLNTSCDSVINSSSGHINKWISFSDLPLLFFGVNTASLLFDPVSSVVYIGFFSLLSVPVLLYSIWLQKTKIRKWCALCLLVSFLVMVQGIYIAWNFNYTAFYLPDGYYYFLTGLFFTAFWLYVKPIIETHTASQQKLNQLTRFKRNSAVFEALSKEVVDAYDLETLNGIRFGEKDAPVHLVLFLSPSCSHCHKAYEETKKLFVKFPEKFSFTLHFNINPENKDNPYRAVVQQMLAIDQHDESMAIEAIDDWHIHQMPLNNWLKKWERVCDLVAIDQQINENYLWCAKNDFNYSPVKLVNGKLFPDGYEISELQYFLNHFGEQKNNENLLRVTEISH